MQVVGLEARLVELEASQKDLTDHKYRSQAAIRELKSKLKTSEEVCLMVPQLHGYKCVRVWQLFVKVLSLVLFIYTCLLNSSF